jgi:NAD(P)-dependent dehydrogenase (short-subunit alcohol dehydrogenase family)
VTARWRNGRIDGLCNAAGITTRGTLLDTTAELFDTHIAVNLRGPFFAMGGGGRHDRTRTAGSTSASSRSPSGGQGYLAPYVAARPGWPV